MADTPALRFGRSAMTECGDWSGVTLDAIGPSFDSGRLRRERSGRAIDTTRKKMSAVQQTATPVPEPVSIGRNLTQTAARKPNAIAVSFEDQTLTWGDLHKRTNRIARALERRGVKQGDFVTIALPNGIGFIEAAYAAWKLGATPQPVSSRLPLAELKAIVELAKTPVVFSDVPVEAGVPIVSTRELAAEISDDSDLPDRIAPSWKAPTS